MPECDIQGAVGLVWVWQISIAIFALTSSGAAWAGGKITKVRSIAEARKTTSGSFKLRIDLHTK